MTEDRLEERAELEKLARWALEHPEQLEPREVIESFRPILRLWQYPSFFDYASWTIFQPARRNMIDVSLLIRRVVWERTYDLRRFSDPLE